MDTPQTSQTWLPRQKMWPVSEHGSAGYPMERLETCKIRLIMGHTHLVTHGGLAITHARERVATAKEEIRLWES